MNSRLNAMHGFDLASVRQPAGAATRSRRTLLPLVVALVGAGLVAVAGAAIALNGLLTDDGPTIALGLADLAIAAYLGAVVARLVRD